MNTIRAFVSIRIAVALIAVAVSTGVLAETLPRSPAPDGARVYILSPKSGEVVTSPVTVVFGLSGMGVAPAGLNVEGTGHHHLLIDVAIPDPGKPIPADDQHRHFGKGQTEATIELAPGRHTLQLLLGDHLHIPHDPPIASEPITITVE
ncbi:MAG TPA: rod shape-determining protein RodA [Xanthomonadales bacterium]|nr:rod shape-determining protein RodA [Xanthomonadales bacterium]